MDFPSKPVQISTIGWQSDCNFNHPAISRWTIKHPENVADSSCELLDLSQKKYSNIGRYPGNFNDTLRVMSMGIWVHAGVTCHGSEDERQLPAISFKNFPNSDYYVYAKLTFMINNFNISVTTWHLVIKCSNEYLGIHTSSDVLRCYASVTQRSTSWLKCVQMTLGISWFFIQISNHPWQYFITSCWQKKVGFWPMDELIHHPW